MPEMQGTDAGQDVEQKNKQLLGNVLEAKVSEVVPEPDIRGPGKTSR